MSGMAWQHPHQLAQHGWTKPTLTHLTCAIFLQEAWCVISMVLLLLMLVLFLPASEAPGG